MSPEEHEAFRLLKLKEKFDHRDLPRLAWLDRLALRQLESYRLGLTQTASYSPPASHATPSSSGAAVAAWELDIEFPYFPFPVVYNEPLYDSADVLPVPVSVTDPAPRDLWRERLHVVWDPEADTDNPAENKYHKVRGCARACVRVRVCACVCVCIVSTEDCPPQFASGACSPRPPPIHPH